MKRLVLFLLLAFVSLANARPPVHQFERINISGSDFIRIDEWSDAHGYSVKWNKAEGTVKVVNGSAHLEFTIDSRRAEINGVTVWLSLPVVNRSGGALLSVVDASTAIEPILYPQKTEAHLTTICLDPGHGGKDTGEIAGHNLEKTYTLLLAREVSELLKKAGFKTMMTREADAYIDLPTRPLMARRQGADLFVSLHYNSADGYIRGLEVYCLSPAGMNSSNEGGGRAPHLAEAGNAHDGQNAQLAYQLEKTIAGSARMEDRGMKRARFQVLREAHMPAVLIEGGFMSNPSDAKRIYDPVFRKQMAQAIVDGIVAYKKAIERTQETASVNR